MPENLNHMPERVVDSSRFTMPSYSLHDVHGFQPVFQPIWTNMLAPISPMRELDINGLKNAQEVDDYQRIYMGLSERVPIRGL
jgi:hypothetical protein